MLQIPTIAFNKLAICALKDIAEPKEWGKLNCSSLYFYSIGSYKNLNCR
jgi:hypothetical protein